MIGEARRWIVLFRYIWARCLFSHRWVPPLSLYFVASASLFASGGDARGSGALSAALLLPISAWMSVTALNADDSSQVAIVSTSFGSYLCGRAGIVVAVMLACGAVGAIAIVAALILDPTHGGANGAIEVAALLAVANVTSIVFGATLGLVCARPIILRPGTSWLTAATVSVIAIAIPWSPFPAILSHLSATQSNSQWPDLASLVTEMFAVSTVMFVGGLVASRRLAN